MIRAVAAVALLTLAAGCASTQSARLRAERLTAQLDGLRYQQPLDDVWDEVRRLLADRGYPLAGADAKAVGQKESFLSGVFTPARETFDPGDDTGLLQRWGVVRTPSAGSADARKRRALETGWRRTAGRYRADAFVDAVGVQVIFTRFDEVGGDDRQGRPSRDPELELDLARRLDPRSAERIEQALQPKKQ